MCVGGGGGEREGEKREERERRERMNEPYNCGFPIDFRVKNNIYGCYFKPKFENFYDRKLC